jgi:4-diphosphocytidyl-2-C-methyl-D-erythritol kinase
LPEFTLPSFAKINWTLRVLGRRTDGFHEVVTVLQTVSPADALTFAPRADGRVTLTGEGAQNVLFDETNLVWRAADALRERFDVKRGAALHLAKRIPAGGGLGGGSSNAAVALLGLAQLWQLPATADDLGEIGARLGADVPFFLHGGTALGTGRGADLEPLPDAPAQHLVILAPGVSVATAAAYRALRAPVLTKADAVHILAVSRAARETVRSGLCNDFERIVLPQEPEIARAKDALVASGARAALMSGSGSCVFGVFDNQTEQRRAAARLATEWRVFPCATLARAAYREALKSCAARLFN